MNSNYRRRRVPTLAAAGQHMALCSAALLLLCCNLTAAAETGNRTLHVRSIPAVTGYSSNLYEVYMPPYFFDGPVVLARAVLSGMSEAEGRLELEQVVPPFGPVAVRGNATGLSAGLYRLLVTAYGDLRDGCDSLRPAYSPYEVTAEPGVLVDLGGVLAGKDGSARVELLVPVISLTGPRSVAGRGLVLRRDADGGGAGSAICGTIAYSRPPLPPRHPGDTEPASVERGEGALDA